MTPDKYYGDRAKNYDAERQGGYWNREQEAIKEMVKVGPVLDVPVGTARFGEIFNKKGLHWTGMDISDDMLTEARLKFPNATLIQGSIFELPFNDDSFGTVVCNRLLYFFTPEEMVAAVKEICRVSTNPVMSIRTGPTGIPKGLATYTHDEKQFLNAVGDKLINGRRVVSKSATDTHTMYSFRKFDYQTDFVDQFQWHKGGTQDGAQRLAQKWFDLLNIKPFVVLEGYAQVEYWHNKDVHNVLQEMIDTCDKAGVYQDLITDEKPKGMSKPPVIICENGKYAILDGRRRTNQLKDVDGITPVIIVEDGS